MPSKGAHPAHHQAAPLAGALVSGSGSGCLTRRDYLRWRSKLAGPKPKQDQLCEDSYAIEKTKISRSFSL